MTILQAIVLGITQGVTEFAPVSSSGHLIIVPWLFEWPILTNPDLNKTFDVALHIGTLVGALVYFRHDVARYLAAWVRSIGARRIQTTDQRLAWALVIGTIPAVIAGVTLESFIQDELGQPWLIAIMLVVFGVVLYVVDRVMATGRHLSDLGVRDGLIMGAAQALALQPGVSRSGVTMTAGRLLTFDRETAARFSFLLAMPVVAGAGLYKGVQLIGDGLPPGMAGPFVAGMIASAVSGFLVIAFLLRYLRRHLRDLGIRDGLLMGVAQALALQPGVSRSGVTMTAGRLLTFDRETAARFSFLLSLPVIAGAGLYKGIQLIGDGLPPGMAGPFVVGMIASAISGFLVIAFLLRYLRRHDFALFMWFRIGVAALVLIVIVTGTRPATI